MTQRLHQECTEDTSHKQWGTAGLLSDQGHMLVLQATTSTPMTTDNLQVQSLDQATKLYRAFRIVLLV